MDTLKGKLSYIKATDKNGNCISKSAKIEKGAVIENSILGDKVIIGKDTVIKNCVLWNNVKVDMNSRLHFDVVANNCSIGQGARITWFCIHRQ